MFNSRLHVFGYFVFVVMLVYSCSSLRQPKCTSDIEKVKESIRKLTKTNQSRNYLNISQLNSISDYLFQELKNNCDTVYFQNYIVEGKVYKNVIGSIGIERKDRLIVGAHYDVAGEQEGADDNASGVAGILEIARILSKEKLNFRIDFVAYTLEEPPFFKSKQMGSYVHAKSLKDQKIDIKGMICLEMIGYYSDKPGSQNYPIGFLKWFYGDKGNFITVVQNYFNGNFGKQVEKLMTQQKLIPTKSFKGPKSLPGIDFSDHLNYWKFGFNAVMITNTSFYRNPNYHKKSDTLETLDLDKTCKVIDEVCTCILNLN